MNDYTNDPVGFARDVLQMEITEAQAQILRNIPDGSKPMRFLTGFEMARIDYRPGRAIERRPGSASRVQQAGCS